MSSPFLSGRPYAFDLEIVKSTSSRTSQTTSSSSSPSSTLSESSNSPLAISTRKPRTPRKRPNQTYNEAAALLSTAYPKIFPAASVPASKPFSPLQLDSSELLFFPVREKLKDDPKRAPVAGAATEVSSRDNSCQSSSVEWKELCGGGKGRSYDEDDFDAESMLDEEIDEGGIDSIMGNPSAVSNNGESVNQGQIPGFVYGYPPGFSCGNFHHWVGNGVSAGGGNRGVISAFRRVDDWWSYPVVDVLQISPRLDSTNRRPISSFDGMSLNKATAKQSTTASSVEKKKKKKKSGSSKKKKKKVERLDEKEFKAGEEQENCKDGKSGLLLKLNCDAVLKAWSGKDPPFPEDGGRLLDGNDFPVRVSSPPFPPAGNNE